MNDIDIDIDIDSNRNNNNHISITYARFVFIAINYEHIRRTHLSLFSVITESDKEMIAIEVY